MGMIEHLISSKIVEAYQRKSGLVVAFCGAADLGKSYLSEKVTEVLQEKGISSSHLTLDSFLMDRADRKKRDISGYDVQAHDIKLILSVLEGWKQGKDIQFRPYDHHIGSKSHEWKTIPYSEVLIIDGLFSMHEQLLPKVDLSFFIYTDDETLKKIKLAADLTKRNYTQKYSEDLYEEEFKIYQKQIEPFKGKADFKLFLRYQWEYVLEEKV